MRGAGWLILSGLLATPALADPPPDGGTPQPTLSAEDQEVVENLDLLQNLEEAKELDTMLQLAEAEKDGGDDGSDASPR